MEKIKIEQPAKKISQVGTCGLCRHCHTNDNDSMECRIKPPVVMLHVEHHGGQSMGAIGLAPMFFSAWPTVKENQWCSQYESRSIGSQMPGVVS